MQIAHFQVLPWLFILTRQPKPYELELGYTLGKLK